MKNKYLPQSRHFCKNINDAKLFTLIWNIYRCLTEFHVMKTYCMVVPYSLFDRNWPNHFEFKESFVKERKCGFSFTLDSFLLTRFKSCQLRNWEEFSKFSFKSCQTAINQDCWSNIKTLERDIHLLPPWCFHQKNLQRKNRSSIPFFFRDENFKNLAQKSCKHGAWLHLD